MMIVFDKGRPRKMENFWEMSDEKSKLTPEKKKKNRVVFYVIHLHTRLITIFMSGKNPGVGDFLHSCLLWKRLTEKSERENFVVWKIVAFIMTVRSEWKVDEINWLQGESCCWSAITPSWNGKVMSVKMEIAVGERKCHGGFC